MSDTLSENDRHLPALIISGPGLFFPKVGQDGFMVGWRDVQGICPEDTSEDSISFTLSGDLKIIVKDEDWVAHRKTGCPGRATSIPELFAFYGPSYNEDDILGEEVELDHLLTDEEFAKKLAKCDYGRFFNAAIDDLTTAAFLAQLFRADSRIAVDLSETWKGYELVLKLANPASAIMDIQLVAASVPKEEPEHALERQRAVILGVLNYIDRIKELTDAFEPLITPDYLPEKGDRTHHRRLAKKSEDEVSRFLEFAAPFLPDDDEDEADGTEASDEGQVEDTDVADSNKESNVSKEDAGNALEKYAGDIGDADDLKSKVLDCWEKLKTLFSKVAVLKPYWDDFLLIFALLRDYVAGIYRDVSWAIIATLAGALLYILTPFDLVCDLLPGIGFLDDVLVLGLAISAAKSALEAYRAWRTVHKPEEE